ncbi:MAG TPA: tetratricopeptide repeat protein [Bryobacteraceae bacterium]|nr:tetratricopeptide repeat protein [Bryobacteraceae bacterium]
MTKQITHILLSACCAVSLVLAQNPPKPKSQKEVDALLAVQNAKTPDARIAAVEDLLNKFSDTEFKSWALEAAAEAAQQKGDYAQMLVYGQRTLDADPKNYQAMLLMSRGIASQTKKYDLDKEEKLAKAEKYAHTAIDLLKDAPKPNPNMTDQQWNAAKLDLTAEGHEALGMIAQDREKYDQAIAEYKTAVDGASTPDPATLVRLGEAYNLAGKYDDAIAAFDKVLAMADANATVKQIAQNYKQEAVKHKAGAPAATPK